MENNNNIATNYYNETPAYASAKGNSETFKKYILLSLVFASIYTICLYKNHSGIAYPIFMLATLITLGFLRKKDGLSLITLKSGSKVLGIFYVASLMLLSIHKCLTTSPTLIGLDGFAIFLLFFSYVLTLYIDTTGWDIGGWLLGILFTVITPLLAIFTPINDFIAWFNENEKSNSDKKNQNTSAIIIGILCAIPVLIVVLVLLTSADRVFSNLINNIFDYLPHDFWDCLGRIITFVIAFVAAYCIPSILSKTGLNVKASPQGTGNPVIAITFSVIIGAVYFVFCMVQILYLFTGSVALPKGYTYAEYAHEGFYQLLAVCIINVVIVSVCARKFAKSKALTSVLVFIAACTYIMIASSAFRMILYIQEYALTFLRVFVLWFLGVLCIWLATLIVGIFKTDFPVFKVCMITITIAYLGFIYVNPEYQIAKYDIAAAKGDESEMEHVKYYISEELSADAVPAFENDKELLKSYECTFLSNYNCDYDVDDIRNFNFSYYRAVEIYRNNDYSIN